MTSSFSSAIGLFLLCSGVHLAECFVQCRNHLMAGLERGQSVTPGPQRGLSLFDDLVIQIRVDHSPGGWDVASAFVRRALPNDHVDPYWPLVDASYVAAHDQTPGLCQPV